MKQVFLPILLAAPLAADELPVSEVFMLNCSACHAVDQMVVGPSLVEISDIYRNDPEGFVKWCLAPKPKRPGAIEMPSMAHLGEPTLRKLHGYVLKAAEGKTERKQAKGDPFGVPPAMTRRPQVQRIFLPDASPAAIAVALPGDLSYCFDAGECRLRYVWKGGFIDGFPYWQGNGSALATIIGEVTYREADFPLLPPKGSTRPGHKFLGYRVGKDGLPTFRYQRWGIEWAETIRPLEGGDGIERHFESDSTGTLFVTPSEGVEITSSSGALKITADHSKSFTLTYRWK
jgi:cytochrome c551/c552